ncbi:MAG: DUF503 domain-containing protein [Syntrophomonadaceae bacterium]|jgi:uncharacterized protein YlxP (DUF503 family)|nr:DUF503 domain-containing protein [Bacillota bacterium]NLP24969.1 DUF503 domain-containing protein [Syntrophomonadaceae bacterium]
MFVVYGTIDLHLPYSSSLKEKRKTVQAIISRVRKRFNVSISEVDHHELWQRSTIGFAAVSASFAESELILSALKETVYQYSDQSELIDFLFTHISE